MDKEHLTKIDIVRIQMVKDGTIEYGKKAIKGPQDLAELGHKFIKDADREIFLLIALNTRNHINCINVVSVGTINTALVAPREIMKIAILSSAASIACVHNHPSGDPDPSNDDIQITNRIAECGKLFGIELIDHVIIADDGKYESFREKGLISNHIDSPLPQIREKNKTLSGYCTDGYQANPIRQAKEDNFGQQYCKVIGCRKGLIKERAFPQKLTRFKEFTRLMRRLALQGIGNYSGEEVQKGVIVAPHKGARGDESCIHFVLEDLVKKIIRFQTQRSENDFVRLALWAYLLWMKLYPKQDRQERKAHVKMD